MFTCMLQDTMVIRMLCTICDDTLGSLVFDMKVEAASRMSVGELE